MSTINAKNLQVGLSGVAAQNYTWYQPATPDGSVRLGQGNSGVTTADAITVTPTLVTIPKLQVPRRNSTSSFFFGQL